jgi:hypothetical protein
MIKLLLKNKETIKKYKSCEDDNGDHNSKKIEFNVDN